ncbi:hypothetical protein GCM10011321_31490 [Youhaiella tibetensis]|uniref:Uncharacterized protein n=1 Tax=Paradevosia tibetensis TaxID=1447062 RepID=A0A5B9DHZ9_9HYPH|nr:hypothetical protein [Youhaiella tibetensis]QEE18890.1 hypothetical protein FNA67_01270 [Youhaiella tibetensis]GGF38238.1 hypothetical protein GCM10011321_31490 [Youhaiella tibetensis]
MNKTWYRAAPGVEWVNGARVPDDGRVHLTAFEASYDLSLDRISPDPGDEVAPATPGKPRPRGVKVVE